MTGAGDVLPTAPDQNAKTPDAGKSAESQAQGGQTRPAAKGEEGKAAAGAGATGPTSEEKTTEETEDIPAKSKACTAAGKPAIKLSKLDSQDAVNQAVARPRYCVTSLELTLQDL